MSGEETPPENEAIEEDAIVQADAEAGLGRVGTPSSLDVSMKVLCRHAPDAMLRLARLTGDLGSLRLADVSVALSEFRADNVIIVGKDGGPKPYAIQLEYQIQPDARVLEDWFLKKSALKKHLHMTVLLVVIYLRRGNRRSFPDRFTEFEGGLKNEFVFETVRLWENADRIRSGELLELAPLLVLCDDSPTEETVVEELELIRQTPVERRTELLAVAYMVGLRFFARGIIEALFAEEDLSMLKDLGIISDWIAEGEARGRTEGEARGRTEGEARGRADEVKRVLLLLGRQRFGEPETRIQSMIEAAGSVERLERMTERILSAANWDELLS